MQLLCYLRTKQGLMYLSGLSRGRHDNHHHQLRHESQCASSSLFFSFRVLLSYRMLSTTCHLSSLSSRSAFVSGELLSTTYLCLVSLTFLNSSHPTSPSDDDNFTIAAASLAILQLLFPHSLASNTTTFCAHAHSLMAICTA